LLYIDTSIQFHNSVNDLPMKVTYFRLSMHIYQ